ncbi:MAG TPA: o-succinylbenzoate synthase [Coleofasciculaceae cyanobacterium]
MVAQTPAAFEFYSYCRPFCSPLRTRYGSWYWREGIILRLTDRQGRQSFGEIAPIPWFGSETLEQAITWCQQQTGMLTVDQVMQIPPSLPACQFGVESAWVGLDSRARATFSPRLSALLPSGERALHLWGLHYQKGIQTFKWKIGVQDFATEVRVFQALTQHLPTGVCLRLDANGGLTFAQAVQWLEHCDRWGQVEYLEQPLPPHQFPVMQALSRDFATPLALDESISTVAQLQACYDQGWQGLAVIKPAICGFPSRLRQVCQEYAVDGILSSVFETVVGRQAGLALAAEIMNPKRAVGFGTDHWFAPTDPLQQTTAEALWQHLSTS